MLVPGYEHVERRMSIFSRPELRRIAKKRGISAPPPPKNPLLTARRTVSEAPSRLPEGYGTVRRAEKIIEEEEETWFPSDVTSRKTPATAAAATDTMLEGEPLADFGPKKKITATSLMVLLYFWTCGGPFGIEPAVGAGGALLTYVGIFIVCIFWALPQAMMAAELSLMIDVNGGNIIWIKRAFGDFVAFVNAYCYLVLNLSTLAILVVLFVRYIPENEHMNEGTLWGLKIGFVLAVVIVNITGIEWMARLSYIFLFILFSPFIAEMLLVVILRKPINWSNLLLVPEYKSIDWGTLISTTVWSFGGFDSVGSVAGDVKGGKKTFFFGVLGSFPLVILNYFLPVMIGYILNSDNKSWDSGFFTQLAFNQFPYWMGIWVTVASAISNFAQCTSGVAPVSWVVWAMAHGEDTGVEYLPSFFGWEWQYGPDGAIRPISGILFVGSVILALSALEYSILVQLYLILRIFNLLSEYAALIWLKFKEPLTPRPYSIPFGKVGPILLVIPTLIISGVSLGTADWKALVAGVSTLLVVTLLWPLLLLIKWLRKDDFELN